MFFLTWYFGGSLFLKTRARNGVGVERRKSQSFHCQRAFYDTENRLDDYRIWFIFSCVSFVAKWPETLRSSRHEKKDCLFFYHLPGGERIILNCLKIILYVN